MHSHVIGVLILDPSEIRDRPVEMFRRVRDRLRARLGDLPELCERLVPVPFGLAHPELVRDRHFDLDAHLSHQVLLGPGPDRQLEDFVGRFASRRLDRTRPLWEMVVVEGLRDGRVALVAKLHQTAMSSAHRLDLGVVVCPRMVPDPRRLIDGIIEEFRVLRDLAVETSDRRSSPDPIERAVLDLRPTGQRPDRGA